MAQVVRIIHDFRPQPAMMHTGNSKPFDLWILMWRTTLAFSETTLALSISDRFFFRRSAKRTKPETPAVPVGFVFCRVFFQQANVCKAAFSAGHGAHDVLVTGFGAQHIDKAVRRHGGSERSETRQLIAHTHTALVFSAQKRNVQRLSLALAGAVAPYLPL